MNILLLMTAETTSIIKQKQQYGSLNKMQKTTNSNKSNTAGKKMTKNINTIS